MSNLIQVDSYFPYEAKFRGVIIKEVTGSQSPLELMADVGGNLEYAESVSGITKRIDEVLG